MATRAEIIRRKETEDGIDLEVKHGAAHYSVSIVPARGMNREIVGYKVTISNATLLHPNPEVAMKSALAAIERIRAQRPMIIAG
jgi:hypothetical protein